MKEISSGVCPEGTVDNLWNYLISQATGFRMGPPHGPLTREIHESILWVGHSLNLLHPQFDPSQGFFGLKSASGDILTVIIYFDFRNDKVGKESTVTLFWNTFCLPPSLSLSHTRTHTTRCNPKPKIQPAFHTVIHQTELVKEEMRWHPAIILFPMHLPSPCSRNTRPQSPQTFFVSLYYCVSVPDVMDQTYCSNYKTEKKKLYLQLETDLFPVCKRHRPLFSSLNVTYWKAQCKDNR